VATTVNYRPFSGWEHTSYAHLRHTLLGHSGMKAVGCLCDANNGILYTSGIYSNGAGGTIPNWVYQLQGVDSRRRGDAELKVLYDLECEIQDRLYHNLALTNQRLFILTHYGPCVGCRQAIKEFNTYYLALGLASVTIFYHTESSNLFGGINGYGEVDRNSDNVHVKVL